MPEWVWWIPLILMIGVPVVFFLVRLWQAYH